MKYHVDSLQIDENRILGHYLPDSTSSKSTQLNNPDLDNYFQVFMVKMVKDRIVDAAEFEDSYQEFQQSAPEDRWEEAKANLPGIYDGLPIGEPLTVKSYRVDQDSYCRVMIIKYDDRKHPLIVFANGMRLKNKFVLLAYNKSYLQSESLEEGQSRSERIVKAFLNANPNSL